jgi:hypothetical protein
MSEEAADLRVLTRLELYFSTRHTLRTMRLFADLFGNDYDLVIIFLAVAEVGLQAVFHLAAINPETVEIKDLYERLGSAGLSIATRTRTSICPLRPYPTPKCWGS